MRTVLVVDDEWAIADWLEAVLSDAGFRVLVASNGKQALALLESERADLVLTDFMMPLVDGPALISTLRQTSHTASIPIILMSSLGESAVRERCDGFRLFLRKPFMEGELLKAVEKLVPKEGTGGN